MIVADAAPTHRMAPREYLEWERTQLVKHEYHLGEVYAMAGGSPRHNFLSSAVGAELRAAMRGKRCHLLSPGQRISAWEGEHYVYSDAVVVCDGMRLEEGTTDVLANPSVIVEVLCPSTETYDSGAKWEAYQRLASLVDYLLDCAGDGSRRALPARGGRIGAIA